MDLHQASLSWTGERAVAGVTSGAMALDDQVTWEARHLGLRWRMTSRITSYQRPSRFVDEMVAGPFRSFRHEHVFVAGNERTTMVDRLEYRAPLGVLGRLAEVVVLQRYMRSLLQERNAHIKAQAEGSGPG